MRLRLFTALLLVTSLGFTGSRPAAQQADVPKALAPLQGKWLVTSFNGQPIPAEAGEFALVITGSRYQSINAGDIAEEGVLTIDASKTPMWIDLAIRTGDDAGKNQLGLVNVKGDGFEMGLTIPGQTTRPATMDAAELYIVAAKAK